MQTSYSRNPAAGVAGQIADGSPADPKTRTAEGVVVPGCYAIAGSSEGLAVHPAAAFSAEKGLGIAVLNMSRDEANYADKEVLSVLRKGPIWVTFEPDATPDPDSKVYVRITANGAGKLQLGALRADADSGNAVELAGAAFRVISGDVAKVELH